MMIKFQQRFIHKSLTINFIIMVMNNRKIDGLPYMSIVHADLINHLVFPLTKHLRITITCQNNNRNSLIKSLGNWRPVITSRCR